jgi:hypothetical protein
MYIITPKNSARGTETEKRSRRLNECTSGYPPVSV